MDQQYNRRQFLIWACTFEGGLVLVAFLVAMFAEIDPLETFRFTWSGLGWGLLATLPMLLVFGLLSVVPLKGFQGVKRFLIEQLGPSLSQCRWYDLIFIAALAGIGEEILFRGLLQAWFGKAGEFIGLAGSNVLFALAHFITPTYALFAGILGIYLGWIWKGTGESNLLIPIVAHGVYDFIAFVMVLRIYRREVALGLLPPPGEPTSEQ